MNSDENRPFRLNGKRAVVTGGGRGIGRAAAIALARCGADVTVISRTREQLEATISAVHEIGGRGAALVGDIGNPESVDALVEDLGRKSGAPDILVNNAGVSPVVKQAQEIELEEFAQILRTNLNGPFDLLRRLAPEMLQRGSGSIINVTSIASERALPLLAAYNASKAALDELTRTMAVEWAPAGVRVNSVAPAYIETEMTAAIREREKLKRAIVPAHSDRPPRQARRGGLGDRLPRLR